MLESNRYNIVLYDRNGKVVSHEVLIECYISELLDSALLNKEPIKFNEVSFKVGENAKTN